MFNNDEIAIVIRPGHVYRLFIRTSENHSSLPRGIDGRAKFVHEFDAGVRVTLPIGCGAVAIGDINKSITRQVNRSSEKEMTVSNAIVYGRGVTRNGCRSRGWGNGGRGQGRRE